MDLNLEHKIQEVSLFYSIHIKLLLIILNLDV